MEYNVMKYDYILSMEGMEGSIGEPINRHPVSSFLVSSFLLLLDLLHDVPL